LKEKIESDYYNEKENLENLVKEKDKDLERLSNLS
jgi:hypothetical protein